MVRTIISVVLPNTKAEQGKIRHGHSRSTRLSDLAVVPLAGFTFVGTSKQHLIYFVIHGVTTPYRVAPPWIYDCACRSVPLP